MVKLTMIGRAVDGLPLVEGLDDGRDVQDADFYKQTECAIENTSKINLNGNQIETAAQSHEVSQMSSRLTSESRMYADTAKDLNRQGLIGSDTEMCPGCSCSRSGVPAPLRPKQILVMFDGAPYFETDLLN
ncbi:hypothetical protein SASPL_123271 [Salvia splendens]|uniref:Uncharacterized protein n=1 Tax=Salvia splendens TaxID=180675 RepID=A0A8X8XN74_SALSN|nr:hypothetical protein SASPL_123271 [Salvia splendens]